MMIRGGVARAAGALQQLGATRRALRRRGARRGLRGGLLGHIRA